MKVFISGKISNNPNCVEDFKNAETKLSNMGYEVINPTKLNSREKYFDYADFMIVSISLLKKCNRVYFLYNWEDSVGGQTEKSIAKKLGLKIMHEKYFGRKNNKNTESNINQINFKEIVDYE